MNALRPAGDAAHSIASLTWVLIIVSAVVFVLVLVLTAFALWHRGDRPLDRNPDVERSGIRWIVIGGAAVPAVILIALFLVTLTTLNALTTVPADAPLVIELNGRQWWWEVRYRGGTPDREIVSANEIHIPTGERIPLQVTASDVVHSFWVPELHGKIDLVPGRVNTIWLHAQRPGVYRGQCAEYCGLQHALMGIIVVAHEPAEFQEWLAREASPATPDPATMQNGAAGEAAEHAAHGHGALRGREIFERRACALCHRIRGTNARGTVGPDLTHVGSRRQLAAGTLPNGRANLAGWIANPQALKPGAHMPRVPLPPDELHAIVSYLVALR